MQQEAAMRAFRAVQWIGDLDFRWISMDLPRIAMNRFLTHANAPAILSH
jgi:hypothetical protein